MSDLSNNQGRAYEYACIQSLNSKILKYRDCCIIKNSALLSARKAWELIDNTLKDTYIKSSLAMVSTIFDMEPMILEKTNDILTLIIQTDNKGKEGDVRDIVINRVDVLWEIGLSIKHNHFAVKHSRLAKGLDFGKKWFDIECSNIYWEDVKPVFTFLQQLKESNKNWSDIKSKDLAVYVPLLNAFMNEIKRSNIKDSTIPKKMVEYLLGEFDFYKVISIDSKNLTKVQSYNLHGKLNQSTKVMKAKIHIPITNLPTRIISFDFKPNSNNTVELYMDNGWQFSFRIHNASTKVETSLKFDIQIIGMPASIISIDCFWN